MLCPVAYNQTQYNISADSLAQVTKTEQKAVQP
jgi:hypothetical protein